MMQYGGMSHRILLFAKMKGHPLSAKDFVDFAPKVFEKPSRVLKSMKRLQSQGMMVPVGPNWKITKTGVSYIYSIAKPYRGE